VCIKTSPEDGLRKDSKQVKSGSTFQFKESPKAGQKWLHFPALLVRNFKTPSFCWERLEPVRSRFGVPLAGLLELETYGGGKVKDCGTLAPAPMGTDSGWREWGVGC